MRYASLHEFLAKSQATLSKGPVAILLAEDLTEVDSSVRHLTRCGFRKIVLLAPAALRLAEDTAASVQQVTYDTVAEGATTNAVNAIIRATPEGVWLHYCYNAEYLFYPFWETRTVGEMVTFHTEERRSAMLCYVVDLYASDLGAHDHAVSLEDAHMDRSGYYAQARYDGDSGQVKERQLDFFGGLRWRFEEHVPWGRRKIDRIALFRAKPGLTLRPDHTFDEEEYNTYSCPWHHNLTAAICSFRTAKALRQNPGSRAAIDTFRWHNSTPFEWTSQQLLDLGLMEPGQWF